MSFTAGAVPRYGTAMTSMFAAALSMFDVS